MCSVVPHRRPKALFCPKQTSAWEQMSDRELTTPVALFVYNRADKAEQVLDQISAVEPEQLLVVADGPRADADDDADRCEATREVVKEGIDWECDVAWNTAETNLGLKRRFATGLEWIFERQRAAIILEDDCVPNQSFFRFCSEMLDEYRNDERIWDISGSNHLGEWKPDYTDYHFSNYGGIWGWATWRRAWECYDPKMELWADQEIRQRVRDVIADDNQADYVEYLYDRTYRGDIETWDYQWGFARHRNSGLSIVPSKNLVSNIGFGDDATNTQSEDAAMANVSREELSFPLEHPNYVAVDRAYDRQFHKLRPLSHRNSFLRWGRRLYERVR